MEEKNRRPDVPHSVVLEGRSHLSLTGVEDVESFDDGEILMFTSQGGLLVRGSELRIEVLSLESGDVDITGRIDSLEYQQEERQGSGGFWSRVFG